MSHIEEEAAQASVLVVDDELECRESARLVLEKRFWVTTAESGGQALELLRHQRMDVVTLDSMMPGLGSAEILRRIREIDPHVQIVIVSGGAVEDPAHALPHAVSAWIPKPFDTARLVEAVERAAGVTRRARERAAESRIVAPRESRAPAPDVRDDWKRAEARMISHDLKNRLHAILGFARLLRDEQLDRRHAAEALDVIESNAHEATTLTVNFLRAEESGDGSLQLHKTPVCLNQIVEQVMKDEAPRARLRRIDLQADLDSGLPTLDLDVAMIARTVANLLDNALHYSPEGSAVCVETRRFANVVILRVRDHGPGIPPEQVPGLFKRYGRGTKSASDSSTGLGLYLVRTIVEAHGGSVSATSPPDGGTAFAVVLPCPPQGNA